MNYYLLRQLLKFVNYINKNSIKICSSKNFGMHLRSYKFSFSAYVTYVFARLVQS